MGCIVHFSKSMNTRTCTSITKIDEGTVAYIQDKTTDSEPLLGRWSLEGERMDVDGHQSSVINHQSYINYQSSVNHKT